MKEKLKRPLLFVLAVLPFAAVGGYFTGSYAYDSYTPEVQQQILAQVGEPARIVAGVTVPASERLRKKSAL